MNLRITTTTLALALLAGATTGCDTESGTTTVTDPAMTARAESTEAELAALQGRLAAFEAADDTLRERLTTLEADAAAGRAHLELLTAKDTIRGILLRLSGAIDSGDPSYLPHLLPALADDFVMVAVDFGEDGQQDTLVFEGVDGLVGGFGPIMLEAQANLLPSAILVDFADAEHATATFKFANSVRPPSALGEEIDEKVLLFAAITAEFRLEGDAWKMNHIELVHSLAYPGTADFAH